MAAGLGFKTFTTGEVLTAADTNGYLMQGVLVFASDAARDSAITSPEEGQFAYTKDTNGLWYYDGAAWVASGATGDIEGVTAGIGISGGGTSGTVTITNSMATAIDAKGDLIGGTGADAFDRLAVGADGTQLVADSAEATGLKWAAPAASTVTYTTWTPTYTNFTLGNGTLVARYGTSGKFVTFTFAVQLGSTSSVSGLIKFTLPKTPKNTTLDMEQYCFTAFLDSGVDIYFGATELGTTTGDVYAMLSNGTYVSRTSTAATTPFSWTTGDVIQITGVYEEA